MVDLYNPEEMHTDLEGNLTKGRERGVTFDMKQCGVRLQMKL